MLGGSGFGSRPLGEWTCRRLPRITPQPSDRSKGRMERKEQRSGLCSCIDCSLCSARLPVSSSPRFPRHLVAVHLEFPLATRVPDLHGLVLALNPLDIKIFPEPEASSGLGLLCQEASVLPEKTRQPRFPPGLRLPFHDPISVITHGFVFRKRQK
jgi:hypothetical protein